VPSAAFIKYRRHRPGFGPAYFGAVGPARPPKSRRTRATNAHRPGSIGQHLPRVVTHEKAAIGGRPRGDVSGQTICPPLRAGDRPSVDADACRFLAAIHVRSGRIPLPPRCHEDQKA